MDDQARLIAAIVADPDAAHAWDVYRDWLLDRGDPRGEWIAAALASNDDHVAVKPPVEDDLLMSPRLLEQSHLLQFSWWRGFIRGASLVGAMDDPPTFKTLDALLGDPHAALLADLELVHPITETVPLWEAVVAREPRSITTVIAANLGAGGARLAALPSLDTLVLVGRGAFRPTVEIIETVVELTHPSLRSLETGGDACPALLSGRFDLPRLVHLNWGSADDGVLTSPDSFLHRPPPSLRTLTISVGEDSLDTLTACPCFRQLRRFEWGAGGASDALAVLRERAAAFQHLDEVSVSGHPDLVADELDALRAELARALPSTKLDIAWDALVARPPPPQEPREPREPRVYDADSRDQHGRISAIGRFTQSR